MQALISQRAVQKFRRDRDDMDDVKKRLEELMCGEWTDNNAKMLTTQDSKGCRVPLYEIRVLLYSCLSAIAPDLWLCAWYIWSSNMMR